MKRRFPPQAKLPKQARRPEPAIAERETLYGLRAGLACFRRSPERIFELKHSAEVRGEVADLLRFANDRGLPYRECSDAELARAAGTAHHEGLCLLVRPRRFTTPSELADLLVQEKGFAVALDRVRNPYNVGAILRSAAFFGAHAVVLGAPAPHPALAPDAVRVAEGGAEHVRLCRTTDLAQTLARLRMRGVRVIGAESDASNDAIGFAFPRPTVVVVGHEREGMSERVRSECDALVKIRGNGSIESLNVSIAASVLIAELVRSARR